MAEVKLKEETELWEPRGPAEDAHGSGVEPAHLKEEPELCIKQEPQEFPFHMVTVKTEDDEDKSSVLHQRPTEKNREETNGWDCGAEAGCSSDPLTQFHSDSEEEEHTDSSEDTDHSEDYSQEQAPAKRSYAMIPPDTTVTDNRSYSCSDCGKRFRFKSHLLRHKLRHTGQKPHKCSVCEKGFTRKEILVHHLRSQHHMCPVCELCFSDDMNLKEHLKAHVEDGSVDQLILKSYSCPECGKEFKRKVQLQEHKFIHSGEKPHKCPDCGKKFARKLDLKLHMLSHTGERPHKCSVCEKRFTQQGALTYHLRSKHHMCTVCKACFPDDMNLKEHLKTHVEDGTVHQSILKSYNCPECGKRFASKSDAKRHMSVHTKERPHKCSFCGKDYKQRADLAQHLKRCSRFCPVCKKAFPGRLKEHLKSHEQDGTVDQSILKSCSECGKEFTNGTYLRQHTLRVHTEGKLFHCSICEKTFKVKLQLKVHMRTHTGEKPNVCSVCQKGFTKKCYLTLHQKRVHYMCSVCEEGFPDTIKLKKHLKSHVEDGTVDQSILRSCSECGKEFTNGTDLRRHMLVHPEKRPH